jgi:hypothetical protein
MLVCRDLSELFDMEMGASPMACYGWSCPTDFMGGGKPIYFNIGTMLLNPRAIRENDAFRMGGLTDTVRSLMLRCVKGRHDWYCAHETYLNHIFDHGALARLQFKYNAFPFFHFLLQISLGTDFDEICEGLSNPAIIHYLGGHKPNTKLTNSSLPMLRKWWEHHALSPFADAKCDATRLEEIIEYRKSLMRHPCSHINYYNHLIFDDVLEAIGKLKHFQRKGTQIVFYGAGRWGTLFAILARSMGLVPDKVCDLRRCGETIGGAPIEPPDTLGPADGIVALAIADPRSLAEAKDALLGFGFPENRILPVFEQLLLGGRRWGEILSSLAPAP